MSLLKGIASIGRKKSIAKLSKTEKMISPRDAPMIWAPIGRSISINDHVDLKVEIRRYRKYGSGIKDSADVEAPLQKGLP
jgi:hypothetical protein